MQKAGALFKNLDVSTKIDNPHFIYALFMKYWKEKFQNPLEVANYIFDHLKDDVQEEWNKVWLAPIQDSFLKYLFSAIGLDNQEIQKIITKFLKSSKINNNIYVQLRASINQMDDYRVKDVLKIFCDLSREYIEEYQENIQQMNKKYQSFYRSSSWTFLFWTFQIIGVIENFSIMRKNNSDIDISEGIYSLYSPSHSHYLINPKETIFILAKTNLHYWNRWGGSNQVDEILKRS